MQIRKNHTPSKIEKLFMAVFEIVLYGFFLMLALGILVFIGRGIWWLVVGL